MVLATLDTRSFSFVALGLDKKHAERVMRCTWREHIKGYEAECYTWAEVAEDVNYVEIAPGTGLRDFDHPLVQEIA